MGGALKLLGKQAGGGGGAYQATILADSPTVYWPLTDAAEPLVDLSGNGYSGDANATVTFSQAPMLTQGGDASCGFVNGGTTVDGSEIATASNPSTGGGMTIEAWFDSNNSSTPGGIVISMGNGNNGLAIEYNNEDQTSGALNYLSHSLVRANVANFADNAIHHVVATRTAGAGVIVYLDGVSVGNVGSVAMNALLSTDRLLVGRDRTVPRGMRGFTGRIGHAAFYNSVLTAARVSAHYNAGIA